MTTMMAGPTPPVAPPKLYRIGEITAFTGLSRQTIHNYTTMGLITEADWTPGGHRLYGEQVFSRLHRIAELKPHKSMQQIKRILDQFEQ
jgi:DNA-binding transcriptional MerR regulator